MDKPLAEPTSVIDLLKLNPDSKVKKTDTTSLSPNSMDKLTTLISQSGINLNLDIFCIDKLCNSKNTLVNICMEIYEKNNIIEGLSTSKSVMMNFLSTVQSYYINNYYHNYLHAADVTNTIVWLINQCGVLPLINDTELYAMIIGATVHDVGHPGFNNQFLTKMKTTLSLIYNDQSVLENYHCFLTFQILSKGENNILKNYKESEVANFRKTLIHIVLNTDLSKHAILITEFSKIDQNFDIKKEQDKLTFLSLLLKTADLGHAAKNLELHKYWSRRVTEEFWNQGD